LVVNQAAVSKLLKLPNFRNATHAAVLSIPAAAGVHKTSRNHHDFWHHRAANMTDFVSNIVEVAHG
jgi:hypothetical protein